MQFKQFPLSFSRKILGRTIADSSQTKTQRVVALAQLAAMGTLMGAVVVQTQQVVSGKQPYKIDSLELWTRSFVLASPLGLMTDVFLESGGENLVRLALGLNAKQIDITKLIFGPLFSDLAKGTQLVGEAVGVGANSLLTEFGIVEPTYDASQQLDKRMSKLTQWALRQVPGQNLWQTKALYNMLFADALQEMMDPQGYRRAQRYIQKDSAQRIDNEAFNPYGQFLEESKKSLIQ